jgi:cytochrome P450
MFASRGDDWKRFRSIASPTFTSGKMKRMYPSIGESVTELLDILETHAKEGKDVNIKDIHGSLTMDVIARCAFATKTNAIKDPNNQFTVNGKKIFAFKATRVIPALLFPTYLNKILNIKSFIDESANQFFFDLTRHILKTRRNGDGKYNDFIQLLIDAEKNKVLIQTRDENDVNEAHYINEGESCLFFKDNCYHVVN